MEQFRSRNIVLTCLTVISILVLVMVLVPGISADENSAAVVIKPDDVSCGFLDGNGEFYFTNDVMLVATNSENNTKLWKCQASGVPNSSGSAVTWDFESSKLNCIIPSELGGGTTTEWHETVSASGNATLICQFNR